MKPNLPSTFGQSGLASDAELVAQEPGRREAFAVFPGQSIRARNEFCDTDRVDKLQCTACPGGEPNAEDGADVGVVHRGEHTLLQAA